jgi:hypothetical protein
MSWGYFVDLNVVMASGEWKRLCARRLGEGKLAAGWSRLEDAGLEKALGRAFSGDETFTKVLKGKAYHAEDVVHRIEDDGDVAAVRICLLLDKSLLELAYPLALIFEAARKVEGATGTLRIVNDGSAPGENGVELSLAKKKITHKKIEDCFAVTEELMAELYGDLVSAPLKMKSSKPGSGINPFTGKPISSKKLS